MKLMGKPAELKNYASIIINEGVWIGAIAIVFNGVQNGGGSVVGAGAAVNKDIPLTTKWS